MAHFLSEVGLSKRRGIDVLRDAQVDKSTAFTEAQRKARGLAGEDVGKPEQVPAFVD